MIKMSMLVHPLRRTNVLYGDNSVFDLKEKTGRLWFVIDLALPGKMFVPKESSGLKLADEKIMQEHSRRK